ncbi:MAG: hypothetical protein J1G38_00985 [Clostridiales bacterium]|nr:hypothetical protein [Clostridiales bacterium]
MKEYFNKKPFERRTVGFWIGLGAAVLAVISAIIYVAVCSGDKFFSGTAFAMMLVGGLLFAAVLFTNFRTAVFLPVLFYVIGFGMALDYTLPPFSDVMNGVVFISIGSEPKTLLAFTIIFLVCVVFGIVSNFMNMKKVDKTAKAEKAEAAEQTVNADEVANADEAVKADESEEVTE